MKDRTKKGLLDLLLLLAGTLLLAFAVKCIYEPLDMVTGGFSGLAILIKAVTEHMVPGGIPLGVSSLLLNIPVFLWAFWKKGKTFAGKSFAAMILLSLWLSILPAWTLAGDDMVIGCAFGGGIMGFGIGLVLRTRSTTGGTDMLAALLHMKFQQYSIVRIMQVIDAVIVLAGLSLFGLKSGLYAIIAIVITTKVSDLTVEGFKMSKAVYILSEKSEEIAQATMMELDRGMTGLHAKGMYTRQEKCMLLCVVSRKEIVWLKEIVMKTDPKAFLIICDAREVWGEGFQSYSEKM